MTDMGQSLSGKMGLRGSAWLSVPFPGLAQLRSGRWGWAIPLAGWVMLIVLAAFRWERVMAAPGGGVEDRVALLTLVALLILIWGASFRDLRRTDHGRRAHGSWWSAGLRAFTRNRVAAGGAVAIGALYAVALLAPFVVPHDPYLQGDLTTMRFLPPSQLHLLGTDQFGRDVLSRLVYGSRISLSIGFVAVAIAVTIGTVLGALAGYLGGWVDSVIMRLVDLVLSIPRLVLLITIIALFRPSIFLIVVVLGLTQWPLVARLIRGEILSLREREFVQAGVALGYSRGRIVFRHLIPNALAPVIVAGTLGIGETIVVEAGLSFLGLGIQPPTPSWGTMVADGRTNLLGAWWITTFSGLAIVFAVLAFNLAGDGLRDALDPRMRL